MATNGGNTIHGASNTPVNPVTFWTKRYGPIYRLQNYFSGSRKPFDFNILHYANQHSIDGRILVVNTVLAFDKDRVKEIVHGCGETAFRLLFHMGVTPIAHVWDRLYDRLSNLPMPIEQSTSIELAQFLGVERHPEKDLLLSRFVAMECTTHGYSVPEALPFCHDFKIGRLEPPKCDAIGCHTCRPVEDSYTCGCPGCDPDPCCCSGCMALRPSEEPCQMCKELSLGRNRDCPNCGSPSPPSTPGNDLKTLDTEEDYVEFKENYYWDVIESREAEGQQ